MHVAIFTVPAFGHLTPPLGLAAELVRRGHRVSFVTSDEFADKVAGTGADVVRYDFAPATRPGEPFGSDDAWRVLRDIPSHPKVLLDAVAGMGDVPDVVAFDATMWVAGRALSKALGRPGIQLFPCFASNEHYSLSAQLAETVVDDSDGSEWDFAAFLQRLQGFLDDLAVPGLTVEEFFGIEEPRLVFLPQNFQYSGETFGDDHAFVGPCIADRVPEDAGEWSPPGDGRPIVLISLGTSSFNRHPDFFRDCAQAFADQPWHVVMTLGGGVRPEELEPLPDNVEAHNWIPYAEVLRHASVFVTAAGMGSVLESLHWGTPLVVIPQHGEQRVNAQRVVELGLGSRLEMSQVNGSTVRDAVVDVATDQGIWERVQQMRVHIEESGGAARAVQFVEAHASRV